MTTKFLLLFLLVTVATTHLIADESKAKAKIVDTMDLKVAFQHKVEAELADMKRNIGDAKERVKFAPRKNRKKMKFLIGKLEDQHSEAQKDLDKLTTAGDVEWKGFEPKLNTALKNLHQDYAEVKSLMK